MPDRARFNGLTPLKSTRRTRMTETEHPAKTALPATAEATKRKLVGK